MLRSVECSSVTHRLMDTRMKAQIWRYSIVPWTCVGCGSVTKETVSFMDVTTKPPLLVLLTGQLPQRLKNRKALPDPKFTNSGCLEMATPVSWVHFAKTFASSQVCYPLRPRPGTLRPNGTAEEESAMAWLQHLPLAAWVHKLRICGWVV